MTKTQFVDALARSLGGTKQESERALEAVLDTLSTALQRGEKLDWRGFGVFKVRDSKARQARNPRTGEMVNVPAKKVVTFKPGKELSASMNKQDDEPAGILIRCNEDLSQRFGEAKEISRHSLVSGVYSEISKEKLSQDSCGPQVPTGPRQRRISIHVPGVDSGACIQQSLNRLFLAKSGCAMKRCLAFGAGVAHKPTRFRAFGLVTHSLDRRQRPAVPSRPECAADSQICTTWNAAGFPRYQTTDSSRHLRARSEIDTACQCP